MRVVKIKWPSRWQVVALKTEVRVLFLSGFGVSSRAVANREKQGNICRGFNTLLLNRKKLVG